MKSPPPSSPPQRLVDDPSSIAELLQRLIEGGHGLAIRSTDGTSVEATLWSHDRGRGVVSFSADADDPRLQALVESDFAVVTGELDGVVMRFAVHGLMLVRRGHDCALSCAYPEVVERFHRRASVRVKPVARTTAIVRLHHPVDASRLVMRILDISSAGCALFMPDLVAAIAPGTRLAPVLVELDAETRLRAALQLMHITALHPRSGGVRLGCRFVGTAAGDAALLERYVDQAQAVRSPFTFDWGTTQ